MRLKISLRFLRQMGIISGYEDGSFRPLGTITRAEAAKMLYEGWTNETEYVSVSSPSDTSVTEKEADDFAFELMKNWEYSARIFLIRARSIRLFRAVNLLYILHVC